MEYGIHFRNMMEERGIPQEWIERCLNNPDALDDCPDGTRHFIKQIPEFEDRWLRVIVNMNATPPKGVTLFFDRRLRKKNES
jgi:hypothetical protein